MKNHFHTQINDLINKGERKYKFILILHKWSAEISIEINFFFFDWNRDSDIFKTSFSRICENNVGWIIANVSTLMKYQKKIISFILESREVKKSYLLAKSQHSFLQNNS